MTQTDLDLANRLEAFAAWLQRYAPNIRESEIADIRLVAKRIRELTSPPDLPEASRSSHHSG